MAQEHIESSPGPVRGIVVAGRTSFLTPVVPADYQYLHALATSGPTGRTWRLQGQAPSADEFVSFLWDESDMQFTVLSRFDGKPVGLVQAYATDLAARHAKISALFQDSVHRTGLPAEALAMFVEHVFATWPLRKIYFEIADDIRERYESILADQARQEALLEDYLSRGTHTVALGVYSIDRTAWSDLVRPLRVRLATKADSESEWSRNQAPPAAMSLDQFLGALGDSGLLADADRLSLDTELELDSIDILQVILWVEEVAGSEV